jgi:hypothetical protein
MELNMDTNTIIKIENLDEESKLDEEYLLLSYEISNGLLITDLGELKIDEEYYIKIYSECAKTDYICYNGVYNLKSKRYSGPKCDFKILSEFINVDHDSQIKHITVYRYSPYSPLWEFKIVWVDTNISCKIYKPTTEYILK